MAASDRYVVLKAGLALPIEPLMLALELEQRGFQLHRDGETLIVQPARALTPTDRWRIRRWKQHLFAVIAYQEPLQ